jgi:hypothetical protein
MSRGLNSEQMRQETEKKKWNEAGKLRMSRGPDRK